jgi:threonine/homoserine/homoserine lactone efflux protein
MGVLLGLVAFSFVSSVTPGPNNLVLWAAGARFGFRRTVPHVLGTALGIGVIAAAVAAGLGALVLAVPAVAVALKVVGSAYLLLLAYRIARGGSLRATESARPWNLGQAIVFQCVNPKAWIFALAAVSAFRPPAVPVFLGSLLVVATMMLVVVPSSAAWAGGGAVINRLTEHERTLRALNLFLALILAASVVHLWL